MASSTHTHWRMTINNYDATDLALVQQGYPDHIRQLVYTLEKGENGTPHVQAFIKMKRDCRLTHMKKLFPRGNFAYMDTSEYKLNQQRYAQKLDKTAESSAVILNGDPLHTIEGTIRLVIERIIRDHEDEEDLFTARRWVEREMVKEDYTMAKVFVSSTYKTMWKDFGHDMYENVFHTHTHTHRDEILSQQVDIPTTDGSDLHPVGEETREEDEGCSEGDDYEESSCSSYEGHSEGSDGESDEEDDFSE